MKFTKGEQFKVLVFCTSYHGDIHLCKVSRKYLGTVFKLQRGHKYITEITIFKVQRAITPKVCKLLCSAPRFMMLYICVKLHQNI